MPWEEGATEQGGLKGRERSARRLAPSSPGSRGLSGRLENRPVYPGHRPPASALGYVLPARWAGFDRSSKRRSLYLEDAYRVAPRVEQARSEPRSPWISFSGREIRLRSAQRGMQIVPVYVPGPASSTRSDKPKSCCSHQIASARRLLGEFEGTRRGRIIAGVLPGR